jgi:uncharacterized protein with NRDE domain
MCLALLAFDAHPRYAVVLAANRDEYHARPTRPAAWHDDAPPGWLGGRDLEAGGTWLGVTRSGRFALLTNVRDPARKRPHAPSRGLLVSQVLGDPANVSQSLASVRESGPRYNGFNLLAGSPTEAAWTSNYADGVRRLERGLFGLSNALLDVAWPKVERTRALLAAWLQRSDENTEPLFAALADRAVAPDPELPSTGVPLEWERRLSAPFIVGDDYGTRSSTVVTIDRDGGVRFVERSFAAGGTLDGEVEHRFKVE